MKEVALTRLNLAQLPTQDSHGFTSAEFEDQGDMVIMDYPEPPKAAKGCYSTYVWGPGRCVGVI